MRKTIRKYTGFQRLLALALSVLMVAGYFPAAASAQDDAVSVYPRLADDVTMQRMDDIYSGDTLHAGKVTVDKSVSTTGVDTDGDGDVDVTLDNNNNFLVTVSQAAQVMALTSQTNVPVDVVFVLDTSGSMEGDRATTMVTAANRAIAQLMAGNKDNRIGVVAFSSADGYFGNQWRQYGLGTSGGAAANVLTPLGHYTDNTATQSREDDAATNHLRWVNADGNRSSNSNNNVFIMGRGNSTASAGYRRGNHDSAGGTNIQAGIALGAQMLTKVDEDDTYITDESGRQITRIPFIIVLSDGAPTYGSSSENWYEPDLKAEDGDGSNYYTGNGFLAALTAAYYKGKITEHYFGAAASDTNRCFVYTIGVSIQGTDLAELTLDPSEHYNANAYNGHDGRFKNYWNDYVRGNSFGLDVDSGDDEEYTVTRDTITATKNYVNGLSSAGVKMYDVTAGNRVGGIEYNDGYYGATQTSQIAGIFDTIVSEIAKKAISSPTQVDTTAEFDGYVTFTDVIGEYMEVKDMKGILADGNFYRGKTVAQNLQGLLNDPQFDAALLDVIGTWLTMTGSDVTAQSLVAGAATNNTFNGVKTQAYYNNDDDYSNSIVWWGKTYDSDDTFEKHVQTLGHAADDSVEYIQYARENNLIPTEADVVCRSYFFYGTAGNTVENPNHMYMYFVVRVERSLTAPYQQTVTVSAPASLLSVEKVYVTEDATVNPPTYTVEVEEAEPAHVVYEVGLRSDINAYNVSQIVGADPKYIGEKPADNVGGINYDPATDTYYFYTNDWDRVKDSDTHTRAMSKATFYAAENNPYYTYQENTYLYDADGKLLTSAPSGTVYYYRDVYSWGKTTNSDGELIATKTPTLIPITIPDGGDPAIASDSKGWYIKAGAYTASVMSPDGTEEVGKDPNRTNTSIAVAHPERTGDSSDAHYTVYLGNNGVLSLTPSEAKHVDITQADGTVIQDADGKVVMVGDVLTYTIEAYNSEDSAAQVVITDKVPTGTEFVGADNNGKLDKGVVTWTLENVPAGETVEVSFQVRVTEAALSGDEDVNDITNQATVKIGNNPSYTTNTTTNPPEGKKAVDTSGNTITGDLQVNSIIVYRVRYYNDAVDAAGNPVKADVTITDIIPDGTTYVPGSASHQAYLVKDGGSELTTVDGKTGLQWVIPDVAPGGSGVVSFRVYVDASAKVEPNETVQPESGTITITNNAKITIGDNDPKVTNKTTTTAGVGDIAVTKTVRTGFQNGDGVFTLKLTETEGKLNGTYGVESTMSDGVSSITFVNGVGTVQIRDGEKLIIKGLPLGTEITVTEDLTDAGWSNTIGTAIVKAAAENPDTQASEVPVADVTNIFTVTPVSFQLKGTKYFAGNVPDMTFTFNAVQVNADGSAYTGGEPIQVTATATKSGDMTEIGFAFNTTTFTGVIDQYYKISEEAITKITGLTTDTTEYMLHLVTTVDLDEAKVNLRAWYKKTTDADWTELTLTTVNGVETTASDKIVFTNTYAPLSTSLTLSGDKTLVGRYLKAGEFSFQLVNRDTRLVEQTAFNSVGTQADPSVGGYSFTLNYSAKDLENLDALPESQQLKDGEGNVIGRIFHYAVREVQGNASGMEYDPTYYEVTVQLQDVDGQLVATPQIKAYTLTEGGTPGVKDQYTESSSDVAKDALDYTNTFTIQNTSVTLTGVKTLTGAGANGLAANDFSFEVVEAAVDGEGNWTATSKVVAVTGNGDDATDDGVCNAEIKFSPINYTPAQFVGVNEGQTVATKTFHYIVREVVPAEGEPGRDPSMKYSDAEYRVTVEVEYDRGTGVITVKSVTGADLVGDTIYDGMDFINERNEQIIRVRPTGVKYTETEMDSLPSNLRFSFRVTSLDGKVLEGTGLSEPAEDDVSKNINFTYLEYDYSDVGKTYLYLIEEAALEGATGVKYSTARYVMAVTIGRDSDYALTQDVKYYLVPDNAGQKYDVTVLTPENIEEKLGSYALPENAVIDFTNEFNVKYVLNITAHKELTGDRNLNAGDFDFRLQLLQKVDGSTTDYVTTSSVVDGVNNADDNEDGISDITFGTLIYTFDQLIDSRIVKVEESEDKTTVVTTYQYEALLSEIEPATAKIAGVDYDDAKYIVVSQWVKTEVTVGESTTTTYSTPEMVGIYHAVPGATEGSYAMGASAGTITRTDEQSNTYDLGVTFENSYSVREGTSATFGAVKTLEGRPLNANEFGFELYRWDEKTKQEVYVASTTNGSDGTISFTRHYLPSIDLDAYFVDTDNDGDKDIATFIYHMVEINTGMGGITYSGEDYWVEVVVTHDAEKAALSVASINYYHQFDATSETFLEKATDEDGMEIDNLIDDQSDVVFANSYTTNDANITPEATKVLLGADTDGDGVADAITDLTDYSFSFEVVETDSKGQPLMVKSPDGKEEYAKVVSTGTSDKNGNVVFTPILYTHASGVNCPDTAHLHYYMIREDEGHLEGVSYTGADKPVYMTVKVLDDGNGVLTVGDVTYYSDVFQTEINAAVFENHYGPGYGVLDLNVDKTVTIAGREGEIFPFEESDFNFVVYEDKGHNGGTYDPSQDTNEIHRGTNAAPVDGIADIVLGSIVITDDMMEGQTTKTFYYHILEGEVLASGITKDSAVITAAVTVKHDGYGNLTIGDPVYTKRDAQGNAVTGTQNLFDNTYVTTPAEVTLTGSKTLINKVLTEEEFTFEIKGAATNPVKIFGDTDTATVGNAAGTEADPYTGSITIFNGQKFTAPGTYTYTVREISGEDENYTYDPTVYTVQIQVADSFKGYLEVISTTITADSALAGAVNFHNTYTPPALTEKDLDLQIGAMKSVVDANGNVYPMEDLSGFYFEILDNKGNSIFTDAEGNPIYGKTNKAGEVIDFPLFTFEVAGEYHYIIREVNAEDVKKPGYVYDEHQWALHILVRYDETTGKLYINDEDVKCFPMAAAQDGDASEEEQDPLFVNVYDPTPVQLVLTAQKTLDGRELKANEFTFRLMEGEFIVAEATNAHSGVVSFALEYTLPGVHTYTVVEVPGTMGGVTYDERTFEVTIHVVDENGVLVAYVDGQSGDSLPSGAVFANTYTAEGVDVRLQAIKQLTGMTLNANMFSFELLDSDGNVLQTLKNDGDGNVSFPISYTMADLEGEAEKVFTYTIREVIGDQAGVTYDANTYTATVTVRDNQSGKLEASVVYSTESGDAPIFHNSYKGKAVDVKIQAAKVLEGMDLTSDAFTFELVDKDGNVVATAKNTAAGEILFTLTYVEAGEHTYTLREQPGTTAGITYDDATFSVTVKVTDDYTGQLKATVTYGTADGKVPNFVNTYEAGSVDAQITATKVLEGKTLTADAFTFQLVDEKGNVVATAKNDAQGKIVFKLTYTEAGEHTYTLQEQRGEDGNITYDASKYTVKVSVVDDQSGQLKATVTYGTTDGKAPTFKNVHTPDMVHVPLTGTKTLTGRDMKDGEFRFEVYASNGARVASGTNDAKGVITFTDVSFSAAGVYELTVCEVKGDAERVTYDTTTFTVTVTVTNENGVLTAQTVYPEGGIVFKNSYDDSEDTKPTEPETETTQPTIPEPGTPSTGDSTPVGLLMGMMMVSAVCLLVLAAFAPRKKGKYQQ